MNKSKGRFYLLSIQFLIGFLITTIVIGSIALYLSIKDRPSQYIKYGNLILRKKPPVIQKLNTKDNLQDTSFKREIYTIFSGKILGLKQDKHKPTTAFIKVNQVYLDLCHITKPILKVTVVNVNPPKVNFSKSKLLYFFGEGCQREVFVFENPKPRWFSPFTGRYQIKIQEMNYKKTMGGGSTIYVFYEVTGQIMDTEEGFIMPTGSEVKFNYENPNFEKGETRTFAGVINDPKFNMATLKLVR